MSSMCVQPIRCFQETMDISCSEMALDKKDASFAMSVPPAVRHSPMTIISKPFLVVTTILYWDDHWFPNRDSRSLHLELVTRTFSRYYEFQLPPLRGCGCGRGEQY